MKNKLQAALQEVCVIEYSFIRYSTPYVDSSYDVKHVCFYSILFDIYNLYFFYFDSKIKS